MIPILFNKDEKTFTSLGLGQMDATLVEVEHERNGNYTLYAEVPFNSPQAKHLTKEMLIKADAGARTKWQTFKINRTIKDTNADVIKVYADHISMDTINDAMKPKVAIRQQTAEGALRQWANSLVSGKAYDVQSDITHVGSTEWTIDEVENARQALGGVQGSILDVWGGEYEFDNNTIILHKEMGRTAPTVLEYGRNIVSLEYEELIDGVYTSIYPYATYTPKSEDNKQLPDIMVTLDELIVDSEYAGNYETRRIQIVDFSNEFDSNAENPEIPTQTKLRTLAKAYVKNNGYGIPKISQEIDFVDLSKTLDYQDIQVMEEIELNDRVPVYYPNIDAETNDVKVTTTNWDVLNNRYSKITLSTIGAMNSNSITSKLNTAIKDLKAEQKKINNTVPYLINGQGNRVWWTTPDENMEHKIDDTWFKKNGKYIIIYKWNGSMWEEVLNEETFVAELEAEIQDAISKVEEAKSLAVSEAESALAQAKADATAKANAIKEQITGEVNTAITTAEDAKALAVSEAEKALTQAKADATAKANAVKEEVNNSVSTAIETAENAKQAAIDNYTNAVAEAERLVGEQKTAFDTKFGEIEGSVSDVDAKADEAVNEINTAIQNAGFTSLDETIQNMNNLTTGAEQNAQQAITDASNAYGLAQTSIDEAQTAQANSLDALGKADNALDGVSNLEIRVDDVEGELELKADNAFINEDGTLTTLSNAITLNADRFSRDMSRIESRVESLAGEINLVVLRGSIENRLLYGTEVFPNAPNYSASTNVMGELIDVVGGETFALSKELTGADDRWRIVFYDANHKFISRFHPPVNTQDLMNAPSNAKFMWVAYPKDSKPQIIRGTDFIPYRPNMADQMTADEVTVFRNEYDEFADKTERRLTSIDSSDGRLATAELLITETANGLALKADQTTVDDLTGTVSDLGTEFNTVAGQVSSKVWKTDIDNIKFGGRNYIPNSDFSNEKNNWNAKNFTILRDINAYGGSGYFARIPAVVSWGDYADITNVPAGIVTLSADVRSIYTESEVRLATNFYDENNAMLGTQTNALTANYAMKRYSFTFEVPVGTKRIRLYLHNYSDTSEIDITRLQLEAGNKITDWIPALEDTDTKITNIETEWTQTFDTFSQNVSDIDGRVTTQKQTIDTISGTVSGHDGRLSTVEQTASGLQKTVADKASQSQVTQLANGYNILVSEKAKSLVAKDLSDSTSGWILGSDITYQGRSSDNLSTIYVTGSNPDTLYGGNRIQVESVLIPGRRYKITLDVWTVSNRYISIGQAGSSNNVRLTVGNTTKTYEVVYEAINTNGFSIYFHNEGTYRIGNIKVMESTAISQSQISVLEKNIDLKVSDENLLSRINVRAGNVLIQSGTNKLNVTPETTYIENATIKSAMIDSIDVKKITGIEADFTKMVTKGLTANVISSTMINANEALFDKLFANSFATTKLAAQEAWIKNANIDSLDAGKINTGEIDTGRIKSGEVVAKGLVANVVKSTHIESSTGLIDKIFANEALIKHLTSKTVFANQIKAIEIDASKITSGEIDTGLIDAGAIVTAGLSANVVESTHIKAEVGLIDKIFSDDAYIKRLTSKTAFIGSIQTISLSASNITTGELDGSKATITNIDAANIVANGTTFVQSAWNGINSNVTIDGTGGIKTTDINGDFSRIVSGELRSFNADSSSTALLGSGRSQYFDEKGSQFILGKTLHGTNWINDGTLQVTYNRRFAIGRYADYAGNNGIFHPYIALEYAPDKPGDEPNGIVRLYKAVYLQKGMYAGNNDISALSKISFYNGGLIESQASTSNLLITASNKMVAYASGTNAFEIDSGYMYLRRNLSMEGNKITNQSDRRLKTNIVDTPVDSLSAISGWDFKAFDRVNNGSHDDIGLLAQDTPEIVIYDEENDTYYINSSKQIMMNSHGIQQLDTKVDDEITQLKEQIITLKEELALIKGD